MSPDRATRIEPQRIQLSRHLPVPHELVLRSLSSAESLKQWFCPKGYEVSEARVEFRVGGAFDICMRSPAGERHWTRGQYVEIFAHDRIVIDMKVHDAAERPLFGARTQFRVFSEADGTRLEVTQTYRDVQPSARSLLEGAHQGWSETLERLAALLDGSKGAPTARSITHGSFTLERFYRAQPERVYEAFSNPTAKSQWFGAIPGSTELVRRLDVRPGGRESLHVRWANGIVTRFDAVYFDVVPRERLIYTYEMHLDARKISVSLASLQMSPEDGGTQLVLTEQASFLDGYQDGGSREQGTAGLLEALGRALQT
ncbi:MAG TPA: SRPBCC family protein [Steroidobacteraceae bacterium]|nr:SRPBCC family protein [Steroidobacteraceae bacterium]